MNLSGECFACDNFHNKHRRGVCLRDRTGCTTTPTAVLHSSVQSLISLPKNIDEKCMKLWPIQMSTFGWRHFVLETWRVHLREKQRQIVIPCSKVEPPPLLCGRRHRRANLKPRGHQNLRSTSWGSARANQPMDWRVLISLCYEHPSSVLTVADSLSRKRTELLGTAPVPDRSHSARMWSPT